MHPTTSRWRRLMPATKLAVLLSAYTLGAFGLQWYLPSPTAAPDACEITPDDLLPEPGKVLLGVNLDWGAERLDEFSDAAGWRPATAVVFSDLPFSAVDRANVLGAADQVRGEHSSLMVTLEPHDGLDTVTDEVMTETAELMAEITDSGVPVVVRFAHEMNGSWYAWSQQPRTYVRKFRALAATLDRVAPGVAMMWAPNYGGGYPFSGGLHETTKGEPGFEVLDTDGDGVLTMSDDPYAPYYPGDDVVDWVGMSLYHWGSAAPWGGSEVPEPRKFVEQLRGTYDGLGGNDSDLPDFARTYSEDKGIPLGIPETAAFVTAEKRPGHALGIRQSWWEHVLGTAAAPPELALEIKRAWWEQVFAPETVEEFPGLAMVNWFEWNKYEVEVDARVDWTIGLDRKIAAEFREALPDWVEYAPERTRC